MSQTRISVEGADTLGRTLDHAASEIEDMSAPGQETATQLANRGRAEAPRRTGRLGSSVRGEAVGKDTAEVTSGLPYANRTHWGYARVGQRAQPWLWEGAEASIDTWSNNYMDRVDSVLGQVRGE